MDFFNRLLRRAGTNTAANPSAPRKTAKVPDASNTPQLRLKNFKSSYAHLLRLWRNGQGVSRDAFVAENTRVVIYRLSQILNGDIRGPTPHLVVSFAFTNGVLRTLVQIATAFCETGITSEVLGVLQLVVDNEEEAFLEDRGLADAVPPFVEATREDILGRQWGDKEEEVEKFRDREVGLEVRLAEVLFGVASAVRNKHLVLKAWFRPEQIYEDEDELTEEEKRTRREDFPLFYLLLEYISANGRVGDFARMGLLYVVEATSYSSALERWLIEGDMADLMASSLGALYSQLSRKLVMAHTPGEEPQICKYGTIKTITNAPFDVEIMGSREYQQHIRTFMASLNFWQDMLIHSPFDNIRKTLLDHFQFLFLQQLLYPSLLESSDVDGGSSVAVTSYLRNILQEVEHPELTNRILSYLFGLPINEEELDQLASATTRARRRKSQVLFSRRVDKEDQPSPELFNLSDLINSGLKSRNTQTVTVTLRLLSTLLTRQHQQALPHLLKTRPVRSSDPKRTLGGHVKEVDLWISLAASLTSQQEIEQSYADAIYDNQNLLETHTCTYQVRNIHVPNQPINFFVAPLKPYVILAEDPTTKSLVSLLDSFLTNDIETNLDLTRVILDIANCGFLRLEGWLVTHPSRYVYRKPDGTPQTPKVERPDDDEDENAIEDDEDDVDVVQPPAREEPAWHAEDRSPIMKSLDRIVAKAESYHRSLQDFDALLAECRKQITSPDFDKTTHDPTLQSSLDQSRLAAPEVTLADANATPVKGHARKTSLADRFASAIGTSPRTTEIARSVSPGGPTPLERLQLRLSEATGTGRPRSSGKLNGLKPESPSPSPRKNRKDATTKASLTETPAKPSHARHRSLRGDDIAATPSPRLDRRVVPNGDRPQSEGSALRRAIGNDSDDDEEDEEDDVIGSGSEVDDLEDGRDADADLDDEEDDLDTLTGGDSNDSDDEDVVETRASRTTAMAKRDITVGHLLTNVVILQEFILEIAALISVRGTTFGEVRFK